MKLFADPAFEIIHLEHRDIITTSCTAETPHIDPPTCDWELPH